MLRYFSRSHFGFPQQLLDSGEQVVGFKLQVILRQNLKCFKATVGQFYVLVHPSLPDESWIKFLHEISRENNQSFTFASRPKSVNKIQNP
uniref:Uncharacterized protein n=1 Tax=Salix viminalis TaxID=40686 RepID=A0A6N2KHG3_SALVM